MVKRYNRLLVAFHVCADAALAALAFVLAYVIRFETGLLPVWRGYPPFEHYIRVLPLVSGLVIFAFYLQGLYRLRRGRSPAWTISSPSSSAASSPSCSGCGPRCTCRRTT